MSTLETLQSIMSEEYHVPAERLQPQTALKELGVDSLALLELMFKVEDRFELKIKDDIPRSMETVQDVVSYIDSLLAGRQAEPPQDPVSARPP